MIFSIFLCVVFENLVFVVLFSMREMVDCDMLVSLVMLVIVG